MRFALLYLKNYCFVADIVASPRLIDRIRVDSLRKIRSPTSVGGAVICRSAARCKH
jgi:hypothetical protein